MAASVAASLTLLASTALTWYGLLAVAALAVLLLDAQRRVRDAFNRLDGIDKRIDAQKKAIDELKALVVTGDDGN